MDKWVWSRRNTGIICCPVVHRNAASHEKLPRDVGSVVMPGQSGHHRLHFDEVAVGIVAGRLVVTALRK